MRQTPRLFTPLALLLASACASLPETPPTEMPLPRPLPTVVEAPAPPQKPSEEPAAPAPLPTVAAIVKSPPGPRSHKLPSGFWNPMPGGVVLGYQADTGLDIAGSPRPIYALASGYLDYSEAGHTLWTGPKDTPNCVRIELDEPIPLSGPRRAGRKVTHMYYAHLSKLTFVQREGAEPRRHVEAGELIGESGVANHSPHLHVGFLLDGEVNQYWGTFLYADEIRNLLGYRLGTRLPSLGASAAN